MSSFDTVDHYLPVSETPFKWRFAGGPIATGECMLGGNKILNVSMGEHNLQQPHPGDKESPKNIAVSGAFSILLFCCCVGGMSSISINMAVSWNNNVSLDLWRSLEVIMSIKWHIGSSVFFPFPGNRMNNYSVQIACM